MKPYLQLLTRIYHHFLSFKVLKLYVRNEISVNREVELFTSSMSYKGKEEKKEKDWGKFQIIRSPMEWKGKGPPGQ